MSDHTSSALTREAVIAAIDAAFANTKQCADEAGSLTIAVRNIRSRLPRFFTNNGELPATLLELASLEVTQLTRFKAIAKYVVDTSEVSLPNPDEWTLTEFFVRTAHKKDNDLNLVPTIGPGTVAIYHLIKNLYTALGLLDLSAADAAIADINAPLVSAWRDASAGLKQMNVEQKLGFLLTQNDDIIAANSRGYFKALKEATNEYYGTLLTEDLIASSENMTVTRHVVGKHMATARLGSNAQTVLRPYIGGIIGNEEIAFIRSYLATIRDDIEQGTLEELPLKLKMLGRLNLKVSQRAGAVPPIVANTKIIADEVVSTASKALVACVDALRIPDALAIMDVLRDTISKDVVVSSDSFQRLLDKVVATYANYPLVDYQSLHGSLKAYAKDRETHGQLTPAHTTKLEEMAGLETVVRKAMISRLAERLAAKPSAGNEK